MRIKSLDEYAQYLDSQNLSFKVSDLSSSAIKLEEPLATFNLPKFNQGLVSVQDLSAQLAAPLLIANDLKPNANKEPLKILDCCAAPGGKTAHLLALSPNSKVTAVELDKKRALSIHNTLDRLGLKAQVIETDATTLSENPLIEGPFERILVDAPCSGTGVIRRHPDIKWLRREKDLENLTKTQAKILDEAYKLLAPGGILLYTTCSILPSENQEQVLRILKGLPEEKARALWNNFSINYFSSYHPQEIAWHTKNILTPRDSSDPLILFAQLPDLGTEAFIYVKESPFKFPQIATVLAEKNLNVQSARISRLHNNESLCTITFQTQHGLPLDNERLQSLRRSLLNGLNQAPKAPKPTSNTIKNKKIFNVPTIVTFLEHSSCEHTSVEISTLDTPGLLAKIGIALGSLNCQILSARITTTGERADDFFIIVNKEAKPLNNEEKAQVENAIYKALKAD